MRRRWSNRPSGKDVSEGAHVLELTMAAVSAADEGATAGMLRNLYRFLAA